MCFLNAMGWRKGKKFISNLAFNCRPEETTLFETYVKPTSDIIYNRYKFQSRVQNLDDTFEQFVTELQLPVKDCEYDQPDEMVRDRIVTCVKN